MTASDDVLPVPERIEGALYCWRCDDVVRAIHPWPHWKKVRGVWYASMAGLCVIFPMASSDYCVMIPTMMGIIVAGGPIHRYAAEKPTCSVCSAELDPTRTHGTGVRRRTS